VCRAQAAFDISDQPAAVVNEDGMKLNRMRRYGLLLALGVLMSGCSLLNLRPDEGAWQGDPVMIGTVGETRYQLKDLTFRPSRWICDVDAYRAGFRNALVDRWDTNAMLDRLPKRFYLDVPPRDVRSFLVASSDRQCVLESIVVGEADGDRAGKWLYREFLQRLNGQ
jgi:hypothetical protein